EDALHGLRLATRCGRAGVDAWLAVIVALFGEGRTDDAARAAEEALASFPDDAQLWSVAAQLRLAVGQVLEAIEACRRALQLAPGATGPRLCAALLYALRGDDAAARALLADAAARGAPPAVVSGLARAAAL